MEVELAETSSGAAARADLGVHISPVDVSELDDATLGRRLSQIGRARNLLDGYLADAVAEKKRRTCTYDTANVLRTELRQSGRQANRTMRDAEQLEKLDATREALKACRITSEHARILGTAAGGGPVDEQAMLTAAESQTPEQFRRTVRKHQEELAGDEGGAARLKRQREARTASFTEQDDGMWQLYALFDPVTAQGIRSALNHKTDMAWHGVSRGERQCARHRRADAIAELLTRSHDQGGEQPQSTSLVLIADFDVVDQQLRHPRLADGTHLPHDEFHKLACDSDVLPGIFGSNLQCLSLGHQRHPSPQLRMALTARDQGCIGCGAEPEWCVAHHIEPWQFGGTTDLENLVLVCKPCHDKVHHRSWAVEHHPDSQRPYLRPPWQQPPTPTPRQ